MHGRLDTLSNLLLLRGPALQVQESLDAVSGDACYAHPRVTSFWRFDGSCSSRREVERASGPKTGESMYSTSELLPFVPWSREESGHVATKLAPGGRPTFPRRVGRGNAACAHHLLTSTVLLDAG